MTCQHNAGQNNKTKIARNNFQIVSNFKYLGTDINKWKLYLRRNEGKVHPWEILATSGCRTFYFYPLSKSWALNISIRNFPVIFIDVKIGSLY